MQVATKVYEVGLILPPSQHYDVNVCPMLRTGQLTFMAYQMNMFFAAQTARLVVIV